MAECQSAERKIQGDQGEFFIICITVYMCGNLCMSLYISIYLYLHIFIHTWIYFYVHNLHM